MHAFVVPPPSRTIGPSFLCKVAVAAIVVKVKGTKPLPLSLHVLPPTATGVGPQADRRPAKTQQLGPPKENLDQP